VTTLEEWRLLFDLSDRYGFVIAADECYSEIYFQEGAAPLGALTAAARLGRGDFRRLAVFSSLSKRSNVPGMRSGLVAGDAGLIGAFLLYRTYHGSAMSGPVTAASIAAWRDEAHVVANRELYARKFARVAPEIARVLDTGTPQAAFYLWARTPVPDAEFARRLHAEEAVTVLPGSYLAREAGGVNPGANRVRIALVADLAECEEAAARIVGFVGRHWPAR
jgi:N-succinyldiaminopimelate aminotransferase